MNKWVLMIVAVILAIGVGGYSYTRYQIQETAYATELQAGKRAVKTEDYSQAETNFTHASRTRTNDTVAQRYLTQTQNYVSGTESIKAKAFSTAKQYFTTVQQTQHGLPVLVDRSTNQLKLIKTVKSNRTTFEDTYQRALELNRANEFTDSNGALTVLFQDKTFAQSYYSDLYKQAKELRQQNYVSLKALTGSTPVISNDVQKATGSTNGHFNDPNAASQSSSSASSSSNSSSSSASQPANNGTAADSDRYPDAQIQAARAELTKAGLNGSSYNDDQIKALLDRAAAQHLSVVQAAQVGLYSTGQIEATREELDAAGIDERGYTDAQIESILQLAADQHLSLAQAAKVWQQK